MQPLVDKVPCVVFLYIYLKKGKVKAYVRGISKVLII